MKKDYYSQFQDLQKKIEFCSVQEEYLKDAMLNLRKELIHAQEEVA